MKRTRAAPTIPEAAWQRMRVWAQEQEVLPLLCHIDPDSEVMRWWHWDDAEQKGRGRRFPETLAATTAVQLLDRRQP